MNDQRSDELIVLIPVFNDWGAVEILLDHLDRAVTALPWRIRALLIDDGSIDPAPVAQLNGPFASIGQLDVLLLRRNVGHQRALAIGLAYIEANLPCQAVVIMDGDGEDDPADVPRLLARFEEHRRQRVVFAARTRRSEGLVFRGFYHFYKSLHRLLTGIPVRVGNFSVIPQQSLHRLSVVSDLWNHYAAAVFKARLPMDMIATVRMPRLAGESTMNFTSLVIHGLSAISVFGDRVGVRMLTAASVLVVMALAALATVVGLKLLTDLAIPGWATYTAGLLVVFMLQVLMIMAVFVFAVLSGRDSSSFLPIRDHGYFVHELARIYPRNGHQDVLR
jgi:polyisoprenyl-phosphate glycosyltransferase